MKHFQDDYPDYSSEEYYDKPISGLSSEDREYFEKLNDDHSMLYHSDDDYNYDDYEGATIKHFQD